MADKTDEQYAEEAQTAAMDEWMAVLAQLWDAYDKPLDPSRLKIYRRSLAIVPLGLLEQAIDRVIREQDFNTIPPLGKVWQAVREELKLAGLHVEVVGIEDAIMGWIDQRLERCTVRFERQEEDA